MKKIATYCLIILLSTPVINAQHIFSANNIVGSSTVSHGALSYSFTIGQFSLSVSNSSNGGNMLVSGSFESITTRLKQIVEEEELQLPKLSLYPNPAKNQVNISNLIPENTYKIAVYDMLGRQQSIQLQKHNDRITKFNISHLQNGQYLIQIYPNHAPEQLQLFKLLKTD